MPKRPGRKTVRFALLDGHVLVRESVVRLLAPEHDFDLVAEWSTPSEAMRGMRSFKGGVIVIDAAIAREFIELSRGRGYAGEYLVLAREIDVVNSAILLKSGASGIFRLSDSSTNLIQAMRQVANGGAWVSQSVVRHLAERYPDFNAQRWGHLNEREAAVVVAVGEGLSNREIGARIGVSESTVKGALQQLFEKAGVRTRSQLVRIALADPAKASAGRRQNGTQSLAG